MKVLRLVALVVGVGVVGVTAADGAVRKTQLTTTVQAGMVASIAVDVAPKARCAIAVGAGTAVLTPRGLSPKTGGRITWRWRIRETAPGGASPVIVSCGKSGTLKTRMTIVELEPEMSLAYAWNVVCRRAPLRVMSRFGTELVPVATSSSDACRFRINFAGALDFLAFYALSIGHGAARCTFVVWAQLMVPRQNEIPRNYPGPFAERYTETCASLR